MEGRVVLEGRVVSMEGRVVLEGRVVSMEGRVVLEGRVVSIGNTGMAMRRRREGRGAGVSACMRMHVRCNE